MVSKRDRIKQEWEAASSDQDRGFFGINGYRGERRLLETTLSDDEPIEAWLVGNYILDTGKEDIEAKHGVLVATDRRVLFLKKRGIKTRELALGYHNAESITLDGQWRNATLSITSSGNTWIKLLVHGSKKALPKFQDVVNGHIYGAPAPTANTVIQEASPMDELQKAAQLHAAGVLTDSEFQVLKANLLSRI